MTPRSTLHLAATLLLVALIALPAGDAGAQDRRSRGRRDFGSEYPSRIDTTVAFARSGAISLTIPDGEIVVNAWDQDRVQVRATSDGAGLRFDASSSRLTLETNGHGGDDVHFELTVPRGVRIVARAQSGEITIRGTRGEVEASSQSGDIKVADAAQRLDVSSLSGGIDVETATADVELRTVSGDVRLRDVKGDIDVETVSGDIEIGHATAKNVRAHTTSGDVGYDGSIDAAGRYELAAHSGDVSIRVPDGIGAQITVSTWSGAIESDFPITLQPGEHGIGAATAKRFTFSVGNAAARITLESFSGDITINSTGGRSRR